MITIENTFVFIVATFFVLLGIKQLLPEKLRSKMCVLCTTVSLTWVSLLVLRLLGYEIDDGLLNLLVGGSVVGIFYVVENKISEKYHVFRLPFYLTLLFLAYLLVEGLLFHIFLIILLLSLWAVLFFIYALRTQPEFKKFADKLIACCKNW